MSKMRVASCDSSFKKTLKSPVWPPGRGTIRVGVQQIFDVGAVRPDRGWVSLEVRIRRPHQGMTAPWGHHKDPLARQNGCEERMVARNRRKDDVRPLGQPDGL